MKRHMLLGFVALAVASSACARSSGPDKSEFQVQPLGGPVQVFDGNEWTTISEDAAVEQGHQVRSGRGGRARIELPGGQRLELAESASVHIVRPNTVEVGSGRVLAEARKGLTLMLGEVKVVGSNSVFRVGRGISQEVAVYEGTALVPGSGYEAPIPAFEQLGIVGTTALRAPRPLVVDEQDPWDTRFLGEAIDVGAALEQQESGLEAQLGGRSARRAIMQVLDGTLPSSVLRQLLKDSLPARLVIAAIVAEAIEEGTVESVVSEILGLRAQGASWVVIAGRWGVEPTVLDELGTIVSQLAERAIPKAQGPGLAQPGNGPSVVPPSQQPDGPGGGSSTNNNTTKKKPGKKPAPPKAEEPGDTRPSDPGPNPEPTQPPPPPPPPPCENAVECAIEGVIGPGGVSPGTGL